MSSIVEAPKICWRRSVVVNFGFLLGESRAIEVLEIMVDSVRGQDWSICFWVRVE